jgi:hypothetical protein
VGGPVQIGQTIMNLPAVPAWTAKVCKYYAETIGGYFRKRHFFEVVYHQSLNGTWGLDGWKWGFRVLGLNAHLSSRLPKSHHVQGRGGRTGPT